MAKSIEVDKDVQIKIIPYNFVLQRKIKTKNNSIAWHTEGYFPDLISLSQEYLNTAPCRAMKATARTARFEELIKAVKTAEQNIIETLKAKSNDKNDK